MLFPFSLMRTLPTAFAIISLLSACQDAGRENLHSANEREQSLLAQADAARALGRQDEAVTYYHKAAEASRGAIRAHLELADIYAGQKQPQAALDIIQQAYALNPANGEVLKKYAQQLLLANKNEKALEIALEGAQQNPGDVRLLNIAGVAYDRTGQHDKAQAQYQKAMQLLAAAIDREYTINNLALSYIASKKYDRAVILLEGMPTLENKPALQQLQALAYGAKGNTAKASVLLTRAGLTTAQITENLRFYEQLRNGTIDATMLFAPLR